MAVGAVGFGGEAGMPAGNCGMAAVAQLSNTLVNQQVPVDGAVNVMTGAATFHTDAFMFKEEGALFIGMAFKAGLLFKTAQPFPRSGFVGVMAIGTSEDAFFEPVLFIKLEFVENIGMATETDFTGSRHQEGRPPIFTVDGVASGTIHGGFAVGSGHISHLTVFMTGKTGFDPVSGCGTGFKGKGGFHAAVFQVLGVNAVAAFAAYGTAPHVRHVFYRLRHGPSF